MNLDLNEAQKHRLEQLNELDEHWLTYLHHTSLIQQQRTKWHDHFMKRKEFQKGNWALLYDSRFKDFKGKIYTRWLGPYEVDTIFDNCIVKLITIDDSHTPLFSNGHDLRLYHQPLSKDSFISKDQPFFYPI